MQTIDAIKDKVFVKLHSKEEKTEGGIYIPEDFNTDTHSFGDVISVGEEVPRINRGDTIIFHVRGGQDVVLERETYKCLTVNEIYGVMRETKG